LDEGNAKSVANAAASLTRQYGKPSLVIIDTLNRNFGNGDENNTADMTRFSTNHFPSPHMFCIPPPSLWNI